MMPAIAAPIVWNREGFCGTLPSGCGVSLATWSPSLSRLLHRGYAPEAPVLCFAQYRFRADEFVEFLSAFAWSDSDHAIAGLKYEARLGTVRPPSSALDRKNEHP